MCFTFRNKHSPPTSSISEIRFSFVEKISLLWLLLTPLSLFSECFVCLLNAFPSSFSFAEMLTMLYAYADGTASKFQNVSTKNSDARRLPKKHNTLFKHNGSKRQVNLSTTLWSYNKLCTQNMVRTQSTVKKYLASKYQNTKEFE